MKKNQDNILSLGKCSCGRRLVVSPDWKPPSGIDPRMFKTKCKSHSGVEFYQVLTEKQIERLIQLQGRRSS